VRRRVSWKRLDQRLYAVHIATSANDGIAHPNAADLIQEFRHLSRENLMRQATNLKQVPLSLLLPGITLNTTSQDYAPMKQLQLMRFNGTSWDPFGEVMTMP
jgi:hypothetical protein